MQKFGFSAASLPPDLLQKENEILRMGLPPLRIDLLTRPSGVDFNACFANRVVVEIDGAALDWIARGPAGAEGRASERERNFAGEGAAHLAQAALSVAAAAACG